MAGGMGRPDGVPLGARVRVGHTTVNRDPRRRPGPEPLTYGETADYRDLPDGARHVRVNLGDGPQPGLILGWRKPDQLPWEGHVHFAQLVDGRWVHADRWVLASAIEPTHEA